MITEAIPVTTPSRTHHDPRWDALLSRDVSADGTFVYAVTTTGVYCRPTCASRRPHRDHVVFFSSSSQAQTAGYRACRRCHPDDRQSPAVAKLERARRWIDGHEDQAPALATLARVAGLTPSHLQRSFTRLYGVSPRQYAAARRVGRLKSALKSGASSASAVYEAGYGSPSRVYEAAPGTLGMTPRAYRDGGKAQEIRFAIEKCDPGHVLVAATARGLCRVALGDSTGALHADLVREYPNARLVSDDRALKSTVRAVVALANGRAAASLPTDVKGTVFQQQVWKALQAIPVGATRTYAQVATAIGRPSAARAVARACAANPLALVVPCHRVVPSAGGIGGYRWGQTRKRRLLDLESQR